VPPYLRIAVVVASAAGGIVLGVQSSTAIWRGWRSQRWPATDAEIIKSELEERPWEDGMAAVRPVIVYRYDVNGATYAGDLVYYGARLWLPWKFGTMVRLVEEYPERQTVRVRYDPSRPSQSVIRPGVHPRTLIGVAIGIAGIALAVLL